MTSTSVPVPTGSAHPVLRYQLVEKDWKIFPTLFNFLLCNLHAALQDLSIFFSRQCNKKFARNSNLYSDKFKIEILLAGSVAFLTVTV